MLLVFPTIIKADGSSNVSQLIEIVTIAGKSRRANEK